MEWFSRNKTKLGVLFVTALLVFYLTLTFRSSLIMLGDPNWVAKLMGVAYLLLPIMGAYLLIRELLFGAGMQKMARQLEAEGGLPEDTLARTPGGRIVRTDADAQFEQYKTEVESDEGNWRVWYRLSLAYEASGDRRRARSAMRTALSLYRQAPQAKDQS